jgi:hypothetical protein
MTVFSGVSHPDVDGGHHSDIVWLTAAPQSGRGGFRNIISLDQFDPERISNLSRFPFSLTPVSYWCRGQAQPVVDERWSNDLWREEGKSHLRFSNASSFRATQSRLWWGSTACARGRSILDAVAGRAKAIESKVGADDGEKLD